MVTKRGRDPILVAGFLGGIGAAFIAFTVFVWAAYQVRPAQPSLGVILFTLAGVAPLVILGETTLWTRRRRQTRNSKASAKTK